MADLFGASGYLWIKSLHIIFVIYWMAGLMMFPRYLIHHHATQPGSPEDIAWLGREKRFLRIIIFPSMIFTWFFGILLLGYHELYQYWVMIKLLLVLSLTAYNFIMLYFFRCFSQGLRPVSERFLRIFNEFPSIILIFIVILVVVKPFQG